MPDFDPRAYAAAADDEPFDPKSYAAGPEPLDAADAAISGVANAMTFGLAPKIVAGGRAILGKATGDEQPLSELYQKYRQEQEDYDTGAEKASPKVNMAAGFAGGFLNPVNRFLPGGSLGKNVATGVGIGAVQGAAKSPHDLSSIDEAKGLGVDTLAGAGGGAVGGVIGTGLQKAAGAIPSVAKKGAAVLLGAPEDAVERLVANPKAVNAAPTVPESVERAKGLIARLKDSVSEGSQASRGNLKGEEMQFTGDDVAGFFQKKINEITQRAEGALSPEQQATVKALHAHMEPFTGDNAKKVFSGSRVKDVVQSLQKKGNYQLAPGEFSTPDNAAIKGVARDVNKELKTRSPAYADDMEDVARQSGVLNDVQGKFKTDQGLAGLLDRVRRGRAPFAEDAFERLDKEFGTTVVEDLRNSLAKEAFDKGATNGSRNVNLYSKVLGDWAERNHIPFGKAIGALTGATVDRYGPRAARAGINAYNGVAMNPTVQSYVQGLRSAGDSLGVSPSVVTPAAEMASDYLSPKIRDYIKNKYGRGTAP